VRPLDPRLLRYAASARAFFAAGGVLAIVQTAAVIAFAWLVTQVIVGAVGGRGPDALLPSIAALAAVVVVRFVVAWLGEVNATRGAAIVKSQLRARLLDAIDRLGPVWLARRSTTAVGVTAGPGLDALDTYFSRYLPQLILTAVATPIVLAVIWWQDWISGLTVTVTLPLIPVFMVLIGLATRAVQQRQWERLQRLSTAFLDVVGGLSTLTVFGRQHRQSARIRSVTDDYRVTTMRVLRISFVSGFALELAASLSVALVAVSIGVRLIDGSLGLGVGLFVLLLAPEAFLPLRNVGAQFHAAADGVAASAEVLGIIDEGALAESPAPSAPVPSPSGHSLPKNDAGSAESDHSRDLRAGAQSGAAGGLELRGVGVRYGDVVAVAGVDARVEAGAVTALVGASGSGKSSLVAALLGFVPCAGAVLLDGCDVTADAVPRPWLAWAGQRAALVPGTVLENVALGDDTPDAALVRRVLDEVGASGITLEQRIDPRGGGLSGGQAQRMSSARAVYRARRLDCRVVVFDEPTSALDAETEQQLARCLRTLAGEGRVVLVVSHRPALIDTADAVVTLRPAAAAACGSAGASPAPRVSR
jgi:ATP-binding cassette subfamily C protein CydD